MPLFCAALLLTLCVWRMCGEPRLAFCWPFKFKIQSTARARPHRGDGANSSSLYTWHYLLYSLLLSPPAAVVIPANPAFSPLFVQPPKLQYRALMLSVTETVVRKSLVRAEERLCVSVWRGERRPGRERDCQAYVSEFRIGPTPFFTSHAVQRVQSHSV